jgi:hypothetical protein
MGSRFEVSKEHWRTDPSAYANLPAKVVGVIEQWRNKSYFGERFDPW